MRPPPNLLNARNPLYVAAALDDAGLSVYAFRIAGRIARRWSEERGCYESVNNMAEGCGINRKTAWAGIKELLDRGIITEEKRPGQTTRYDFAPVDSWANPSRQTGQAHPASGDVPSEGPSRQKEQGVSRETGRVPVPPDGTQRNPEKGSNERIPSTPTVPKGTGEGKGARRFGEFWDAYPKKRAKKAAEKKWRAKGLDAKADDLIEDVTRRAAEDYRWTKEDGRYIPDPTTYINQERWTDEYEPQPKRDALARRDAADYNRNHPIETYQRNRAVGLAALGVGPGGVGRPDDA